MKHVLWQLRLWPFILKGWQTMARPFQSPLLSKKRRIMAIAQNKDGVAVLIDAPAAQVKSVRVNVTLPADVLTKLTKYAEREGFTRSGFLARAAKKAMAA